MPPLERQVGIFANYCVSGDNAYNVSTNLLSEGWTIEDDSDLVQEKEYREAFEFYAESIDYGETDLFTKEFTYGAAFVFTDVPESLCGIIPMYDMPRERFENLMSDNNIQMLELSGQTTAKLEKYDYLYNNHVIHFTKISTSDGDLTNLTSSSLNDSFAKELREKASSQGNEQAKQSVLPELR